MWSILALGAAERLVNQILDLDAISRIQMNSLQGKMLRVVINRPQLSVDVFIDEHKVRLESTVTGHAVNSIFEQRPFDQAQSIQEATAVLHVDNVVELAKLFLSDDIGTIPVQGDYHLLQDLQRIILQAEPDLASRLSPWVGPALAHEIGKLQQAPKLIQRSLKSHLFFAEDFIKEDAGILAARWEMDDTQREMRQLNQNIDRLEARIQLLTQHIQPEQDQV